MSKTGSTDRARDRAALGDRPAGRELPSLAQPPLRKKLGQHHLRDASVCGQLIDFLRPAGLQVVEVGSGGGVLTQALLRAGASVLAMDLDPCWLVEGRRRMTHTDPEGDSARWLVADATRFAWDTLPPDWLVTGNLPYNVATSIVRSVLEQGSAPRVGFLVQEEVAQRMTAGPGSRRYGLMSLVVQWWSDATLLGVVKPGSFHPPPKVTSRFVGFERRRSAGPIDEYQQVVAVAALAFTHRRKTLANSLRSRFAPETVVAWCERSGYATTVRAENLSLADYRSLTAHLLATQATLPT